MQISQTQQNKSLHACVRWLWTATLQLVIWFHLEKKDVKILVCDSSATWGNLPGCESGQRSKPLVINWLGVTLSDLSTLSNELSRFLFTLFQSQLLLYQPPGEHLIAFLTGCCSFNVFHCLKQIVLSMFYAHFCCVLYEFDRWVFLNDLYEEFNIRTWLLSSSVYQSIRFL